MRRSSTSVVTREEQMKTTMRYNLIPLKVPFFFFFSCTESYLRHAGSLLWFVGSSSQIMGGMQAPNIGSTES